LCYLPSHIGCNVQIYTMNSSPLTWILTDAGKVGTFNQCRGLAQNLGLSFISKTIRPRLPWRVLPPRLWYNALQAQEKGYDSFTPPWPDILIAAGRASVAPALALKKRAKKCFTIIIQNPYMDPCHFDCVIAPSHDRLKGNNVFSVLGSLHGLNDGQLAEAALSHPAPLPSPVTTVLIGGDSYHYSYKPEDMTKLGQALRKLGGHFLISASRRTRPELLNILEVCLKDMSYEMWKGQGNNPNPYYAYLALADRIIVTEDSISMATEACFTGKPVYIWELPRRASKSVEFYNRLYKGGYARPYQWPFPEWTPFKLSEMDKVIVFINQKISLLAP
jgi:mitochondrial fission protein ELM1